MSIQLRGALALAVGGVLVGCATTGDLPEESSPGNSDVVVEVTNNNWLDMRVYTVRSGMRVRLGTVRSMGTERFRVPDSAVAPGGTIRLLADPIGSPRAHLTEPIPVARGDRVRLNVEHSLAHSSYAVIRR